MLQQALLCIYHCVLKGYFRSALHVHKSCLRLRSFWILTHFTHTHHLSSVICRSLGGLFNTHTHTRNITQQHSIVNYKPINSPNEEHSTWYHTRVITKQKSSDCAQKCQYVNKGRRSRFGFLSNKIFTTSNIIRWLILRRHHYAKHMRLSQWSSQNLTTARVKLIHDCDMITHYPQFAAMLLALVV